MGRESVARKSGRQTIVLRSAASCKFRVTRFAVARCRRLRMFFYLFLGLTPQALCCRLFRRLISNVEFCTDL